jgi:prepilin peptidase CpaA
MATCAVLVPGLVVASWIDYSQRRVPNWLNASLAAFGFIAQATWFGWSGVGAGALGLLVGLGVLILPPCMHRIGIGRLKLMAAIGVWLGPWLTFVSFLLGAVIGGAIAVVMIVSARRVNLALAHMGLIVAKTKSRQTLFSEFASARSLGETPQLLPYGVPLSIGTVIVLSGHILGWWVV